ncbi:SdiA-regulated domain-containing protein, partial [uncultured Pseudomonas sp.]
MFPLFSPRTLGALLGGALLLALTLVAQQHRLFERLWFNVQSQLQAESRQARSLWLPGYRVTVEARPIGDGITDVSALSFDPDRRTLVSVTNKPARFLELDLDGRLLRQVELRGFSDPEAIEYIAPGVYMISEERRQRLVRVRIGADTRVVDIDDRQVSHPFSLSDVQSDNRGNEGLAYDAARERFFVAKESDPVRIYEIEGLGSEAFEGLQALSLRTDPQRDRRLFVRDL